MDRFSPSADPVHGVYGAPPPTLADIPPGALQLSPLVPGAASLEAAAPRSLDAMTLAAPPGTQERRAVIALALRALRPGAPLTVLAPKDKGGQRLAKELAGFGCGVALASRQHYRIAETLAPDAPIGLDDAIADGAERLDPATGLWTRPGIFSFDRIDPGSALLLATLEPLAGRGADLGSGLGVLSRAILAAPKVEALAMIDIDRRAVEAARRNVEDPRADIRWADLREPVDDLVRLDFVVTNPPFHEAGSEDHGLGRQFIRRAAEMLRPGGRLWLVANRHLPYEAELAARFKTVRPVADAQGYKVLEARR